MEYSKIKCYIQIFVNDMLWSEHLKIVYNALESADILPKMKKGGAGCFQWTKTNSGKEMNVEK